MKQKRANRSVKNQRAQIPVDSFVRSPWPNPRFTAVASTLLSKVAKHLALLACLLIAGKATGRFTIGEPGIFLLTIFATMAHLFGRALSPRSPNPPFEAPL
jgi:hypothetical protein